MSAYRWFASIGVMVALLAGTAHYTLAPISTTTDGVVVYVQRLGPVWPIAFGLAATFLVLALTTRRGLYAAHLIAASCLAGYAVALWGTVLLSDPTRGVVTAGFATALTAHALLLSAIYSPQGVSWTHK